MPRSRQEAQRVRRRRRPFSRIRRWARHTPNGTIALNLFVSGLVLLFVAGVLALTLH